MSEKKQIILIARGTGDGDNWEEKGAGGWESEQEGEDDK